MRVHAFQTDLVNAALGQGREYFFVLTPFLAQGVFPIDIGLDAIAIANVHGSGAGQPLRCALQGFHAPVRGFFHVDIESGFVKLNDVDTVSLQSQGFLVQQLCKCHRHFDAAVFTFAIKTVGHGVHDGHGARQCEFDFACRVCPQQLGFHGVHTTFEAELGHDLRHHRVIAVVANAHLDFVLKVNAFDLL